MRFNVSFFYRGHKEKAECAEETGEKISHKGTDTNEEKRTEEKQLVNCTNYCWFRRK